VIETLFTDRLLMRPFTTDDLEALAVLHAEPNILVVPRYAENKFAERRREFLERTVNAYESSSSPALHAVVECDSNTLIGWDGLSIPTFLPEVLPAVEVGWRLGAGFRGRDTRLNLVPLRLPGALRHWVSIRS
jgi:RimJ/RimL family protein N-acetyltransferase